LHESAKNNPTYHLLLGQVQPLFDSVDQAFFQEQTKTLKRDAESKFQSDTDASSDSSGSYVELKYTVNSLAGLFWNKGNRVLAYITMKRILILQ